MGQEYRVIIPNGMKPEPSETELDAAWILLRHFNTDIVFIERNNNKTPDFTFCDISWELKSPEGNGAKTIDNILRDATKQSENIIINLRSCKMDQRRAFGRVEHYLSAKCHGIKRLLIITKNGRVVDFFKR